MTHKMVFPLELVAASFLAACSGPPETEATCPGGASSLEEGCPPPPAGGIAGEDACPGAPPCDAPDIDSPPLDAPSGEPPSAPPAALLVARTAGGGVALVDVASGAVLAEAPGGGPGGPEADIACDPWQSRVLVFESDPGGEGGEVASHPIDQGEGVSLGPRDHEVWIDGIARVAPSPSGAIVFEDGAAGPRWKLVSEQGPTPSMFAPRPASLAAGLAPGGLFQVTALTYGPSSDALEIRAATVGPGGLLPEPVAPLALAPHGDWPSVRSVWTGDGPHLLSALGGALMYSADASGPWTALAPGAPIERLEHAVALEGGGTIAALVSGNADIVAVKLAPDGSAACAAAADLPGAVSGSVHFFTRGLVAAGPGRALAATSEGVFAVTVSSACPLTLAIDPTFPGDALRGPLDVCPARE